MAKPSKPTPRDRLCATSLLGFRPTVSGPGRAHPVKGITKGVDTFGGSAQLIQTPNTFLPVEKAPAPADPAPVPPK